MKKFKITALKYDTVYIDPLEVIEQLMQTITQGDGWITEKDGKYYRNWEQSAGTHSIDREEEISEETYLDYQALERIKTFIIINNY